MEYLVEVVLFVNEVLELFDVYGVDVIVFDLKLIGGGVFMFSC